MATLALCTATGALSKLVLNHWCRSVKVTGLERFLDVLRDEARRREGRGLLTYANHISVMDDPVLFGTLPLSCFANPHTVRWTLGASDIMFTNPLFSSIFHTGQVIPTDRGRGPFQPAIDTALDKLEDGEWVHLFPEGYVNVSRVENLRRFKWGVGRLVMEAARTRPVGDDAKVQPPRGRKPVIVPIWIRGFDAMMPEQRKHLRGILRPGADISVTFGDPVSDEVHSIADELEGETRRVAKGEASEGEAAGVERAVRRLADAYPAPGPEAFPPIVPHGAMPEGGYAPPLAHSRSALSLAAGADLEPARRARSILAAELRARLAKLGREVEEREGKRELAHRVEW